MSEKTTGMKIIQFLKDNHLSKIESVDDTSHAIIYYNMGKKSKLLNGDLHEKIDAIIEKFNEAYFARNIKSTVGIDIPPMK